MRRLGRMVAVFGTLLVANLALGVPGDGADHESAIGSPRGQHAEPGRPGRRAGIASSVGRQRFR